MNLQSAQNCPALTFLLLMFHAVCRRWLDESKLAGRILLFAAPNRPFLAKHWIVFAVSAILGVEANGACM